MLYRTMIYQDHDVEIKSDYDDDVYYVNMQSRRQNITTLFTAETDS